MQARSETHAAEDVANPPALAAGDRLQLPFHRKKRVQRIGAALRHDGDGVPCEGTAPNAGAHDGARQTIRDDAEKERLPRPGLAGNADPVADSDVEVIDLGQAAVIGVRAHHDLVQSDHRTPAFRNDLHSH